jgi:hypothetical protein
LYFVQFRFGLLRPSPYRDKKVVGVFVRFFVRRWSLYCALPLNADSQARAAHKEAVWHTLRCACTTAWLQRALASVATTNRHLRTHSHLSSCVTELSAAELCWVVVCSQ